MSLFVQVRDKKRNIERQITRRSYMLMQSRYELLDAEPPAQKKTDAKSEVAEPAEIKVNEIGNEVNAEVKVPKKRGPKPKQA